MKRYHGASPLERKRSMPAWLTKPSLVVGVVIAALDAVISEGLVLFSGLRG